MTGQWANEFDYTAAGFPLSFANEYENTKQHTETKTNTVTTMPMMMMIMMITWPKSSVPQQ